MNTNLNNILLFKTNLGSAEDVHVVRPVFDRHPAIEKWSVDLDDEDRILRVLSPSLNHNNVIDMVALHGYNCEELKD